MTSMSFVCNQPTLPLGNWILVYSPSCLRMEILVPSWSMNNVIPVDPGWLRTEDSLANTTADFSLLMRSSEVHDNAMKATPIATNEAPVVPQMRLFPKSTDKRRKARAMKPNVQNIIINRCHRVCRPGATMPSHSLEIPAVGRDSMRSLI